MISRAAHGLVFVGGLHLLVGCSLVVDDSPLGCAPHRLCSDLRSICVDDGDEPACQPLIDAKISCSETFPPLDKLESLRDSDLYHIGLIAARPTGAFYASEYGVPTTQAVSAATHVINDRDGLGGPPRKLLVTVCEQGPTTKVEQEDEVLSFLRPRVDHLSKRLRVPAIIGASTSGATERVNALLGGTDVLLLSPSATNDALTGEFRGDQQLFWRTIPPDSRQIPALKKALELAKVAAMSAEPGNMKIAAVWDDTNSAARALFTSFKSDVSEVESIRYLSNMQASKDEAIRLLREKLPRFILPFGTDDFTLNMLGVYESGWPAGAPRPWYIMSEGNRGDFTEAMKSAEMLPARVIGTAPGAHSSSLYVPFVTDFKQELGESETPGALAEFGFDAAFLLAYAATHASVNTPWPQGPELVASIKAFSCKESQSTLLQASQQFYKGDVGSAASARDCYDFKGASGELDYTEAGRVWELKPESSDMALWCLGNPSDPKVQYVNLGYYYNQVDAVIDSTKAGAPELSLGKSTWCADALR